MIFKLIVLLRVYSNLHVQAQIMIIIRQKSDPSLQNMSLFEKTKKDPGHQKILNNIYSYIGKVIHTLKQDNLLSDGLINPGHYLFGIHTLPWREGL